jgi:hypothetical protein
MICETFRSSGTDGSWGRSRLLPLPEELDVCSRAFLATYLEDGCFALPRMDFMHSESHLTLLNLPQSCLEPCWAKRTLRYLLSRPHLRMRVL